MSVRELVVLGTGSQAPTRYRNHNGYLLRFDGEAILFDPGEGTQRQMLLAGCAAPDITRICVSHFHGDHALGLAGVLQRLSLDGVGHPVPCCFPASGRAYFDRLRRATVYHERAEIVPVPLAADGPVPGSGRGPTISARELDHVIDCYGYRVAEPDGRRMLPDRLAALGVHGPDIGRLQHQGSLVVAGHTVTLEEVSVPRRGQVFAFVMDTRLCASAVALAADADLLVAESTFLDADAPLAAAYGHMTARQAGRLAAEAGAHTLVLTHFSQRYPYEKVERFRDEAAEVFPGPIHLAADLDRITLTRRTHRTTAEPHVAP